MPLGWRNKNPGNVRISGQAWRGKITPSQDPDFETFSHPVFGIRATMRILLTYYRKYGLDTVAGLVTRYAPPSENITQAYIDHVAKDLHMDPHGQVDIEDPFTLRRLTMAIVKHELGAPPLDFPPAWYPDAFYRAGVALALGDVPPDLETLISELKDDGSN